MFNVPYSRSRLAVLLPTQISLNFHAVWLTRWAWLGYLAVHLGLCSACHSLHLAVLLSVSVFAGPTLICSRLGLSKILLFLCFDIADFSGPCGYLSQIVLARPAVCLYCAVLGRPFLICDLSLIVAALTCYLSVLTCDLSLIFWLSSYTDHLLPVLDICVLTYYLARPTFDLSL